ncbi:MAG: hypothetical protein NWE92_06915 [Candidatus Bathyarchaeota archaeon]|nr:hypothetical protein [Candidatus Bathyarchaeota archaeon]
MVSKRKIATIITIIAIIAVASSGAIIFFQFIQEGNSSVAPPQFCTKDFVNLDKIEQISLFRSFQGHDYSDSYEDNLSMKHYFTPYSTVESVEIYCPVDGTISNIFEEQNGVGYQVQIRVTNHPEYTINIFHINVTESLMVGESVEAGQQIGTASATQGTDISVRKSVIFGDRLYSYFDVITDSVFAHYQARGASDRSEFIRSADVAKEMSQTYSFSVMPPPSEEWITLNPP